MLRAAPGPSRASETCPPPEGACSEDVLAHVLTEKLGTYERAGVPAAGDPAQILDFSPELSETLATYNPTCASRVEYRDAAASGHARVIMIGFASTLDSLGFFAAQRTEEAKRVLLTSAAYRDQGLLHVYSGWYYLRVQVTGSPKETLPPDQYLAAHLEVRLPSREQLPRLIRIIPRGWVDALTVSYEPTDLLGGDPNPMAAAARQMVGSAHMRLRVMRAPDRGKAQRWYTLMLERTLDRARAWDAPNMGSEGFYSANGESAVGIVQDEFVAFLTTDGSLDEAEAIMRLVGTAIRITRPLPGDADDACPPNVSPAL